MCVVCIGKHGPWFPLQTIKPADHKRPRWGKKKWNRMQSALTCAHYLNINPLILSEWVVGIMNADELAIIPPHVYAWDRLLWKLFDWKHEEWWTFRVYWVHNDGETVIYTPIRKRARALSKMLFHQSSASSSKKVSLLSFCLCPHASFNIY